MKVVYAVVMVALVAGPAHGQIKQMPQYGETEVKTPSEIEIQRKADADYKRSIGNVPNAGPADPWGNMRGNDGKPAVKSAPAKGAKAAPAN